MGRTVHIVKEVDIEIDADDIDIDLLSENWSDAEAFYALARAVRLGQRDEAEHWLDKIVDAIPTLKEQVSLGRYNSRTVREAV